MRAPFDPDEVTLFSRELDPGVFAVLPADVDERDHVATTSGFVIGERAVLVVESLLTGRLAAQLHGLIRAETSKPIRYLVNTSYHGDHCYGNFVFAAEAAIIQHPATKAYLDQHFEDDRAFMLDLMGREKGIEQVVYRPADLVTAGPLVVDLGGRVVEVRHFGFAQTDGDVVVWVPNAEVLWVGNMIQAPSPAVPWMLDGGHRRALETLAGVREFLPPGATIVPGHGRPMSKAEIDDPIAYLDGLDDQVRAALAGGLSLEQAVERVDLPDYERYSLYDWVHREVNVPAAYRDLAGAPR